jgi:hypothetical protein
MNRATLNRLAKLEASAPRRDAMVHVIPAHTDEEFQEKRAAFIELPMHMPRAPYIPERPFGLSPYVPLASRPLVLCSSSAAWDGSHNHGIDSKDLDLRHLSFGRTIHTAQYRKFQ